MQMVLGQPPLSVRSSIVAPVDIQTVARPASASQHAKSPTTLTPPSESPVAPASGKMKAGKEAEKQPRRAKASFCGGFSSNRDHSNEIETSLHGVIDIHEPSARHSDQTSSFIDTCYLGRAIDSHQGRSKTAVLTVQASGLSILRQIRVVVQLSRGWRGRPATTRGPARGSGGSPARGAPPMGASSPPSESASARAPSPALAGRRRTGSPALAVESAQQQQQMRFRATPAQLAQARAAAQEAKRLLQEQAAAGVAPSHQSEASSIGTSTDEQLAALKIQAILRGHKARKSMRELHPERARRRNTRQTLHPKQHLTSAAASVPYARRNHRSVYRAAGA